MISREKESVNKYEGALSSRKAHKDKITLFLHPDEIHLHGRKKSLDYMIPKNSLSYI